jgi:hypothetical protein
MRSIPSCPFGPVQPFVSLARSVDGHATFGACCGLRGGELLAALLVLLVRVRGLRLVGLLALDPQVAGAPQKRYVPAEPTPAEPVLDRTRFAYQHKFFRLDEDGRPMPGTLVKFLVPEDLCDGAAPSWHALQLVSERMGWD